LSAGLYAARARLRTLIIECGKWGGQAATTESLENYPGSINGPTGPALTARMKEQAEEFGARCVKGEVVRLENAEKNKGLILKDRRIEAKAVIIATGAQPQMLGVPGELELRGKGVSYCATCDGDFFTDLDVAVVGGGDAAAEEAVYLTRYANSVTIIHRRDELRAAKSIVDKVKLNKKINILWDSVVESICGDGIVEIVKVRNLKTGLSSNLPVNGVFVYVGTKPMTEPFAGFLAMDGKGYLLADEEMRTSVLGVFAAGDVRVKSLRQVVTAAADGAIAAVSAEKYIEKQT